MSVRVEPDAPARSGRRAQRISKILHGRVLPVTASDWIDSGRESSGRNREVLDLACASGSDAEMISRYAKLLIDQFLPGPCPTC